MSQLINIGGQVTLTNNNLRTIISLVNSLNTTGDNSISTNANVTTAGWQVIDQGSNDDFRMGFFTNLNETSSIQLAINNTSSYAAWLQPGDVAILPNSGSCILYAQAIGASTPATLQYLLTEE